MQRQLQSTNFLCLLRMNWSITSTVALCTGWNKCATRNGGSSTRLRDFTPIVGAALLYLASQARPAWTRLNLFRKGTKNYLAPFCPSPLGRCLMCLMVRRHWRHCKTMQLAVSLRQHQKRKPAFFIWYWVKGNIWIWMKIGTQNTMLILRVFCCSVDIVLIRFADTCNGFLTVFYRISKKWWICFFR